MAETVHGTPGSAGAAPASGAPPASYEFTPGQNETIRSLAAAMRWVAIPLIVVGVLYAVAAVIQLVSAFTDWRGLVPTLLIALGAAIYLTLGIWTRRAAGAFTSVVSTAGSDIAHLMEALDSLRKKYSLLALFVKIYAVLLIVAVILAIIGAFTGGFGRVDA